MTVEKMSDDPLSDTDNCGRGRYPSIKPKLTFRTLGGNIIPSGSSPKTEEDPESKTGGEPTGKWKESHVFSKASPLPWDSHGRCRGDTLEKKPESSLLIKRSLHDLTLGEQKEEYLPKRRRLVGSFSSPATNPSSSFSSTTPLEKPERSIGDFNLTPSLNEKMKRGSSDELRQRNQRIFQQNLLARINNGLCCYYILKTRPRPHPTDQNLIISVSASEFPCWKKVVYLTSYNPFLCNECFTGSLEEDKRMVGNPNGEWSSIPRTHRMLSTIRVTTGISEIDIIDKALQMCQWDLKKSVSQTLYSV